MTKDTLSLNINCFIVTYDIYAFIWIFMVILNFIKTIDVKLEL